MTTAIEYALMAGASYISNRDIKNQFPIPLGWAKVVNPDSYFKDPVSGFEAVSFTNGTEIVISFAGTDFSKPGTDFINNELYAGSGDGLCTIRTRWREASNDSALQFFLARSAA